MSGFYCTDEFGDALPGAAAGTGGSMDSLPAPPAVPPCTPVTNPFLEATTPVVMAPCPLASSVALAKAASLIGSSSFAQQAPAPTPVGNPFEEEVDVFAVLPPVVMPSPAKAATVSPALVVSPTVAKPTPDAFWTPDATPPSSSFNSPAFTMSNPTSPVTTAVAPVSFNMASPRQPVVPFSTPVTAAPPVVVMVASPRQQQAQQQVGSPKPTFVDTSDFDPYSPKRLSVSGASNSSSPAAVASPQAQAKPQSPAAMPAVQEAPEEAAAPAPQGPATTTTTATAPTTTTAAAPTPVAPPEGVCLARLSTRSIFTRDWKPAFWTIINQRLWIYRSRADFKPTDYIHDPFSERIKKSIPLRENLRITEIKSKMYPGETRTLYTFNIEDMDEEEGGKSLVAKFSGYNIDDVKRLHFELDERVFAARHGRK